MGAVRFAVLAVVAALALVGIAEPAAAHVCIDPPAPLPAVVVDDPSLHAHVDLDPGNPPSC